MEAVTGTMLIPEPPQGWKNLNQDPWLMLSEDPTEDGVFWIVDVYGGFPHATDTLEGGCIEIIDSCYLPKTYFMGDRGLCEAVKDPWVGLRGHVA